MTTLRQLSALSLIAQTGSFTRTAELLSVTQSAVSVLIRELEAEIGRALVERGRVARLTAAGERLQRAGRRAMQELESAKREIKGTQREVDAVLRVAAGSLSAATFLPKVLAKIEANPAAGLRMELIDRPVAVLTDLLRSGEADVAIGSVGSPLRASQELEVELLLEDELCVVASRRYPGIDRLDRKRRSTTWSSLRGVPLILLGRNTSEWQRLFLEKLALHEELQLAYEVQLYSTALALVRQGLGVAILPRFAIADLTSDEFAASSLGPSGGNWKIYWVNRKRSIVSPPAFAILKQAVFEVLRDYTRHQIRSNAGPGRRSGDDKRQSAP